MDELSNAQLDGLSDAMFASTPAEKTLGVVLAIGALIVYAHFVL